MVAGQQRIDFTDPDMETRDTIHAFLTLAERDGFFPAGDMGYLRLTWRHDIERLEQLLAFLQKYECGGLQDRLLLYLCHEAHIAREGEEQGAVLPLTAFIIGAQAGCLNTCVSALGNRRTFWSDWGPESPRDFEKDHFMPFRHPTPRRWDNMFNPACLPRSLWRKIPDEYAYALVRAWKMSYGGTRELARQFELQMARPQRESGQGWG